MWIVTVVSVIVAAIGFILFGWLRSRTNSLEAGGAAKEEKIEALEKAAAEELAAKQEKDIADAKEASTNAGAAGDWLRSSWTRP